MNNPHVYLVKKYRQERAGFAPWRFIATLPDDELRADLQTAQSVPDGQGNVIGAWLAQALRYRPLLLDYPTGF
jgi:hypothetical protein